MIIPETDLELQIISSEEFKSGASYRSTGRTHPERSVEEHIEQILAFIDLQPWATSRERLRLMGLLHDLGKVQVVRDPNGRVVGPGHSLISEQIARKFTTDKDLLYDIGIHDKYIHFFRNAERKRFDPKKFIRVYTPADLDLLTRFNYADSNSRERDSVCWFEDRCVELNLKEDKIYRSEPNVLS